MKQEDKDLLLKDLCSRLPYDVKVQHEDGIFNIDYISSMYGEVHLDIIDNYTIDVSEVKPYLFPLSSMTEEKEEELIKHTTKDWNGMRYHTPDSIDWLNAHHFDYRGLIPKGLAIDATGLNIY